MGERRRLRVTAECSRGAYGIRTRATAVRGRRPRPLDECAVRRQRSDSGLRSHTGTEAGPPTSVCARCPTNVRTLRALGRLCSCAHEISTPRQNPAIEGGPAPCGPNAGPPIVPESSAVLPSLGESRRVSGTLRSYAYAHEDEWQVAEVENEHPKVWRSIRSRLTARSPRRRLGSDPRGAPTFCGRRGPPSCSGAGLLLAVSSREPRR